MFLRLFILTILFSFQIFAQAKPTEIDIYNYNIHVVPKSLLNNISVDFNNTSMLAALNEISAKGAIDLSYDRDILPLEKEVTLHVENVNTIETLLLVLQQTSSKLQITKNGSLIILPIEKEEQKGKIKGVVVDANSGEPLIGANVIIAGTSVGAAANIDGEFVLAAIKPGSYTLKISYVGYKDKIEKVTVVSNRATEIVVKLDWVAMEAGLVEVTAQAKGQMAAINEQLTSNELKNVVSKDRIRELPDANAAESVGRLPGVSLLRSNGEGNKVVIRGMQPKYSLVMVDGVPLAATDKEDRSVSMGSISSYSLEGIEVIKSPTANMDGDQVGGSVNFVMKTASEGLNYEVIAQGGYNGLRKKLSDYQFVGSISNRFLDNKLGVFAQITTDKKNMGSNSMTAGYDRGQPDASTGISPLLIRTVGLTNKFIEKTRYGGTLTLDYKLPDGKIYFKNFFTTQKSNTQKYREFFGGSHSFSTTDSKFQSLMYSNIIGYEQYVSIFKINAKLANSYSGSEVPNELRFNFKAYGGTDMKSFDDDVNPEDIPNYANNIFENFTWQGIRDAESKTEGRQLMASLDFTTDFTISNQINGKIKFGGKFRYDERSYDYDRFAGSTGLPSGTDYKSAIIDRVPEMNSWILGDGIPYPRFFDNGFSHGEFLNGAYTLGPVSNIDLMHRILDVMYSVYNEPNQSYSSMFSHQSKASIVSDYTGLERLGAGYLMAEIDITDQIKFIPGVRYEAKETDYNGVFGPAQTHAEIHYNYSDTSASRNNDFWLPMIHLRYEPFNWMQIRMAYTHTIARPNFKNILPTMNIGDASLTMNNPNLRPEQAENIDVYFAFSDNHLGLLTIGGFYKNIKDKIFLRGERVLSDPSEYGLDSNHVGFLFTTQENNEDVSIVKGVEIDWQTNFWYLPSFLSGLVLNVNYTKIYSETLYPQDIVDANFENPDYFRGCGCPRRIKKYFDESYYDRLQNQPSDIINVGIGYDYKGFSTRLSMNYSSDIFVKSDRHQENRTITDDYTRWDLSVTQKLPWEGLQVYCNVTNLSGAIEKNHRFGYGGAGKPSSASHYGSTIYAGIRWRTE